MTQFPIAEYFNRIPVFPGAALTDDGQTIAYISSLTGAPQIWVAGISPQGLVNPKPITNDKSVSPNVFGEALVWIDQDRLLAMMDQNGDEQTFLQIINLKTGERTVIDRVAGAKDFLSHVSKDKKQIFFTSNRTNRQAHGLFTYDLKTRKITSHYQHETETAFWLPHQTYQGRALFGRSRQNRVNTLHTLEMKTGKVVDLFTGAGTAMSSIAEWKNGKILVATDLGRQFIGLGLFDPKTQEVEFLGKDQWDVEEAQLSPDKKTLLVLRNVAGATQLSAYAWPSMKPRKCAFDKRGTVESLRFTKNGKHVLFSFTSPVDVREYFHMDMRTLKFVKLTDHHISRVPKKDFVRPSLVKFPSEGREIHSWFYLPKNAKKGKTPVVIWPHGGPQWQERAFFRPIFQYLVGRGFALWAPNHTGSTGYGKDFTNAICRAWGTADLPDMKNGIEWLKKSGWIDPQKIAIMGGSYGGYMTLRSITKIPNTYCAAVDVFGVSNMLTFVTSVPEDWRPFMDSLVGNPEADREMLMEQSPINALENIDCPLLVIQGALDPRVVKAESDQVVEKLTQMGREVDYLVFDDEGHGFLKLDNELKAYSKAAEFLERHLQG